MLLAKPTRLASRPKNLKKLWRQQSFLRPPPRLDNAAPHLDKEAAPIEISSYQRFLCDAKASRRSDSPGEPTAAPFPRPRANSHHCLFAVTSSPVSRSSSHRTWRASPPRCFQRSSVLRIHQTRRAVPAQHPLSVSCRRASLPSFGARRNRRTR